MWLWQRPARPNQQNQGLAAGGIPASVGCVPRIAAAAAALSHARGYPPEPARLVPERKQPQPLSQLAPARVVRKQSPAHVPAPRKGPEMQVKLVLLAPFDRGVLRKNPLQPLPVSRCVCCSYCLNSLVSPRHPQWARPLLQRCVADKGRDKMRPEQGGPPAIGRQCHATSNMVSGKQFKSRAIWK